MLTPTFSRFHRWLATSPPPEPEPEDPTDEEVWSEFRETIRGGSSDFPVLRFLDMRLTLIELDLPEHQCEELEEMIGELEAAYFAEVERALWKWIEQL